MLLFYAVNERLPEARKIAGDVRVYFRNPQYFEADQREGDGALVLDGSPNGPAIVAAFEARGKFAAVVSDSLPDLPDGITKGRPLQEDRFFGKDLGKVSVDDIMPAPKRLDDQAPLDAKPAETLPVWPLKTPPGKYKGKPHRKLAKRYVDAGRPEG